MADILKVKAPLHWEFRANRKAGVCRLAQESCEVEVTLSAYGLTGFPDVCEVEAWLDERLKSPITAEELTVEVFDYWKMSTTVTLHSRLHGPLTCKRFQ